MSEGFALLKEKGGRGYECVVVLLILQFRMEMKEAAAYRVAFKDSYLKQARFPTTKANPL